MESTLRDDIYKTIKENDLKAFSCFDFLDLAVYKTISKCLERMEDNGEIRRVLPGIYDLNTVDQYFGEAPAPDIEEVANALAREYMWSICPSGNVALNKLGLSSQVPSSYVFLSSGPYREYMIGNTKLSFKHTSSRDIGLYSKETSMLIETIKELGEENITDHEINVIKESLTKNEKKNILQESKNAKVWIRSIIEKICLEAKK